MSRRRAVIRSRPSPDQNACWALLIVDSSKVRKKARRDYEKALKDLKACQTELARYQQDDVPQFTRWMAREFGPFLTELRDLQQKLDYYARMVDSVEEEVFLSGCSYRKAYERVKKAERMYSEERTEDHQAAPEPELEPESDEFEEPLGQEYARREEAKRQAREEERLQEMLARPGRDESYLRRLKETYRAVVRKLHPDTAAMTPQKAEWWLQAQDAYQNEDLEQLELILTMCELEDSGQIQKAKLSILFEITRQFKRSLRALRKELTQYRKNAAWAFSLRTDCSDLERGLRHHLESQLQVLRERVRLAEEMVEDWSRKSPRQRRSREDQMNDIVELLFRRLQSEAW